VAQPVSAEDVEVEQTAWLHPRHPTPHPWSRCDYHPSDVVCIIMNSRVKVILGCFFVIARKIYLYGHALKYMLIFICMLHLLYLVILENSLIPVWMYSPKYMKLTLTGFDMSLVNFKANHLYEITGFKSLILA
jgi:hypothetical protein